MTKFSYLRLNKAIVGLKSIYDSSRGELIEACPGHYKVTLADKVIWIPSQNVSYAVEIPEEKTVGTKR